MKIVQKLQKEAPAEFEKVVKGQVSAKKCSKEAKKEQQKGKEPSMWQKTPRQVTAPRLPTLSALCSGVCKLLERQSA